VKLSLIVICVKHWGMNVRVHKKKKKEEEEEVKKECIRKGRR
jgi:hypothetical protein